jgi:hypothetical protein
MQGSRAFFDGADKGRMVSLVVTILQEIQQLLGARWPILCRRLLALEYCAEVRGLMTLPKSVALS